MNAYGMINSSNWKTTPKEPVPLQKSMLTETEMSLYTQKFPQDLHQFRESVMLMGEEVYAILGMVSEILLSDNETLANQIILKDYVVDRFCQHLNNRCRFFMLKYAPVAHFTRLISSSMRMIDELERIADYAVTISRKVIDMPEHANDFMTDQMKQMITNAMTMLRQALTAYAKGDAGLACSTIDMNTPLGKKLGDALYILAHEGDDHAGQTQTILDLQVIFSMLERVGNRATNLCEEILFWLTGESVQPCKPKIIFMDYENNIQSLMGEAIAKKYYDKQCQVFSAGRQPALNRSPLVDEYMQSLGYDLSNLYPKSIDTFNLQDIDIIISLQDPVRSYIDKPPFNTICLHWDVSSISAVMDKSTTKRCIEESYRELLLQLHYLIKIIA